MLKTVLAITLFISAGTAVASGPSCMDAAKEKKLAGAALSSFMKKCEAEATARCEASAKEKKLAGAAQASFMKKCVADAVGSK